MIRQKFYFAGSVEPEIIRSQRKTISVSVKNGKVIVKAPLRVTQRELAYFLDEHRSWIEKHLEKDIEEMEKAKSLHVFSENDIAALMKAAKKVIPPRVEYYADLMGLEYGRITIRAQKTRWGSCSSKGNLNFNCLLMMAPPDVMDCVIVHELCHLKEMNHSAAFYREINKVMPDYKKRHKWLETEGLVLMKRLRG